jgi:low temperature requirement protein LtrA
MTHSQFKLQVDDGSHRQSDWLELFFDLAFVICIANLSHGLAEDLTVSALFKYVGFLLPIWWVWNQFTWYSAHFNNGDWLFRCFMFAGIAGSLIFSASMRLHEHRLFILAYLFLHLVLFLGWSRAYRHILDYRPYIRLKMTGILIGSLFWAISLGVPSKVQPLFWAAGLSWQLLMPIFAWAAVKNMITVHLTHLMERHGLFTIIVLGECLVSIVNGFSIAGNVFDFLTLTSGFLVCIGLWWTYFRWDARNVEMRGIFRTFIYNYGHFALYASLGAASAGLSRF